MWYNDNMSFIQRNWRTLLFSIIGLVAGIAFVEMLRRDVNLATAMVAFGTLILALVTAMSIDNSRAIEKRNRKERLLNEIIEWAVDIVKCESEQRFHTMSLLELEIAKESRKVQYLEADRRATLINLHQKYQSVDARSEYVRTIAKRFGDNFQAIADQTADKLREQLIILIKQIKGEITPEDRDHM
jgi:hypothetical protein